MPHSILSIGQQIRPSNRICVSGCGDLLNKCTILCRPNCQVDEALSCLPIDPTHYLQPRSTRIYGLVHISPLSTRHRSLPTENLLALANDLCVPPDRHTYQLQTLRTIEKCTRQIQQHHVPTKRTSRPAIPLQAPANFLLANASCACLDLHISAHTMRFPIE